VLALTPSPGNVDLMVASELLEAGRAMQNGFVSPERTTLVASTHRVYTVAEKMAMGDGRADTDRIVKAAGELAKRAVLFDMAELARSDRDQRGAVRRDGRRRGAAASREACEAAIKGAGRGVEGSLKGFASATRTRPARQPVSPEETQALAHPPGRARRAGFPAEAHRILEEGVARAPTSGRAYATLYLDRLEPVTKLDRTAGAARRDSS
jgi:indolepyruvate ferredoxin oxidoreductase beta subunit